jgi:ribosomal protein L13E
VTFGLRINTYQADSKVRAGTVRIFTAASCRKKELEVPRNLSLGVVLNERALSSNCKKVKTKSLDNNVESRP